MDDRFIAIEEKVLFMEHDLQSLAEGLRELHARLDALEASMSRLHSRIDAVNEALTTPVDSTDDAEA